MNLPAFDRLLNTNPRPGGDIAFAALIMAIIGLLIVPLPPLALDLLLTTNIALAVVLLLSAIYVPTPLRLSTFPSMLLVATLFRLALNVSSTRLILSKGEAGQLIASFGDFVVQGNYVVGAVIFLILTLIQFLVIAKGSERVAEVAARFTLDAMPGKQMSIDADLRAGAFGLDEARRRRGELGRESQFFGAMDGAMKFVKGDAIAGLVITCINVVGGLLIGVTQRGMELSDAAGTYTLLTVGDGLVSQIPALLISVCAGIIVTRVAAPEDARGDLGSEILEQLTANPRVFSVAAVLLVALGAIPGLPLMPFLVLAFAAVVTSVAIRKRQRAEAEALEDELAMDLAPGKRKEPSMIHAVTPLVISTAPDVAARIRANTSEDQIRDEVDQARNVYFQQTGVRLPQMKFRFADASVPPSHVRIAVYEAQSVDVPVRADRAVLPLSTGKARELGLNEVQPWVEPISGKNFATVPITSIDEAEAKNIRPMTPSQQVLMSASSFARRHAREFVGIAEIQRALDQLEASHGALIEAVTPRPLSLASFTGVCRRLVEEGVSIRDMRGILEALAEGARDNMDPIELLEVARCGVARSIWKALSVGDTVRGFVVSGPIDDMVRSGIRRNPDGNTLALAPAVSTEILEAFDPVLRRGRVFLCSQDTRRYMRQLLLTRRNDVVVLGYSEMFEGIDFNAMGTVDIGHAPVMR